MPRLYIPGSGDDPRAMSKQDIELWTPSFVGSDIYVSNLGRIYREGLGLRDIKGRCHGYLSVRISKGEMMYLHFLIIHSFEEVPFRKIIKHANKNKLDNRLCNLIPSDKPGKLSDEKKVAIIAALKSGKSKANVSKEFGLTASHVEYYSRIARTVVASSS